MATYSLTLRQEKGSKLTIQEMDNNWRYLDNKQSGSSSFIPNGVKFITESRDLQADDAGYALLLNGDNPGNSYHPIPIPFASR